MRYKQGAYATPDSALQPPAVGARVKVERAAPHLAARGG